MESSSDSVILHGCRKNIVRNTPENGFFGLTDFQDSLTLVLEFCLFVQKNPIFRTCYVNYYFRQPSGKCSLPGRFFSVKVAFPGLVRKVHTSRTRPEKNHVVCVIGNMKILIGIFLINAVDHYHSNRENG